MADSVAKFMPGHYWVLRQSRFKGWDVAYWDGARWSFMGDSAERTYEDARVIERRGPILSPDGVDELSDDARLAYFRFTQAGYCELCGKALVGLKCYCAPGYDD